MVLCWTFSWFLSSIAEIVIYVYGVVVLLDWWLDNKGKCISFLSFTLMWTWFKLLCLCSSNRGLICFYLFLISCRALSTNQARRGYFRRLRVGVHAGGRSSSSPNLWKKLLRGGVKRELKRQSESWGVEISDAKVRQLKEEEEKEEVGKYMLVFISLFRK